MRGGWESVRMVLTAGNVVNGEGGPVAKSLRIVLVVAVGGNPLIDHSPMAIQPGSALHFIVFGM